jgi:hypothetical protein
MPMSKLLPNTASVVCHLNLPPRRKKKGGGRATLAPRSEAPAAANATPPQRTILPAVYFCNMSSITLPHSTFVTFYQVRWPLRRSRGKCDTILSILNPHKPHQFLQKFFLHLSLIIIHCLGIPPPRLREHTRVLHDPRMGCVHALRP